MTETDLHRIAVLRKLITYYATNFAEDPQDGSAFDCAVFESLGKLIKNIEAKYDPYDRS